MKEASMAMEYERAIEYRELLNSVKQVAQKQKITSSSEEDRDIIALARDEQDAVVQVFFIREGKLIGRDHFHLRAAVEEEEGEILDSFVKQFYAGTPFIPRELWLQYPVADEKVISQWLTARKGQRVKLVVPQKGQKERLVELAARNAALVLDQDKERIKRDEQRTIGAVRQITGLMGIEGVRRIEAYDISNTSGVESVGSMVVYEDGRPKRSDYRKLKSVRFRGQTTTLLCGRC